MLAIITSAAWRVRGVWASQRVAWHWPRGRWFKSNGQQGWPWADSGPHHQAWCVP